MALTKNIGLTKFEGSDFASRTVINQNYDKIDAALGIDFVCERGKSGDWEWVKWNSGFMEQWISDKVFPSQSVGVWGSAWATANMTFGNFPIAFTRIPFSFVTFNEAPDQLIYANVGYKGGNSTTKSRSFYLVSDEQITNIDSPHCGIYARGYYK